LIIPGLSLEFFIFTKFAKIFHKNFCKATLFFHFFSITSTHLCDKLNLQDKEAT